MLINKKQLIILGTVLLIILVMVSSPLKPIFIKHKFIFVEVADNSQQRSRGLRGRLKLAENRGMIFVFKEEGFPKFWMKDTLVPLSIAFIDRHKIIVDIQNMKPLDKTTLYVPAKKVKYALEMNAGWFKKNNINIGDKLIFW